MLMSKNHQQLLLHYISVTAKRTASKHGKTVSQRRKEIATHIEQVFDLTEESYYDALQWLHKQ